MDDYQKMTSVIHYITENVTKQPSLRQMAVAAGLSPYYFQKKFKDWIGVSPKAFLQCLTLADAKQYLQQGDSILDVSLQTGLSGPGRLHDLCIKLDAATPGEIKNGGIGIDIRYGFGPSPFGECIIAHCKHGICFLAFTGAGGHEKAMQELKETWPGARFTFDNEKSLALIKKVFRINQEPGPQKLRAYVNGSRFQIKVWRALLSIPVGTLVSYGALADHLGRPGAARAVGSAVAANNLAYLIPCHRIIRNTGVIGEYRWGSERKRQIIAFESARMLSINHPQATSNKAC